MASEDLQLDLSAGLVFAMILVYQIFMDEAREPSVPAEDAFKLTVLFRDEPLTADQLSEKVETPLDQPEQKLALLANIFADLNKREISNYPRAGAAGWGCRFEKGGINYGNLARHAITDSPEDAGWATVSVPVGSEPVEIRQRLDRIDPRWNWVNNKVDAAIKWNETLQPYFTNLPTISDSGISSLTSGFRLRHCVIGQSSLLETHRHPVSILEPRFYSSRHTCPQLEVNRRGWGYRIKDRSSWRYVGPSFWTVPDVEATIESAPDSLRTGAGATDDGLQQFAATLLSYREFGVFSCEATGVGIAQVDRVYLMLEGEPFREVQILATSIQSRSRAETEFWSAWGDQRFAARVTSLNGASIETPRSEVLRFSETTIFEFEL